jgi:transposase InsO family protein
VWKNSASCGRWLAAREIQREVAAQRGLTVQGMCQLVEVNRAGFYRRQRPAAVAPEELMLRDAVQRVALEWPTYGSRRITRKLQHGGWRVNRKRVQRIMREDNLLCLRHRKFVVTTDSNHELPVYPNLAEAMVLTAINQLWRAAITYIRLAEEFVYLAVILDAYSRRVIGWTLDRRLQDSLTIMALEMALAQRGALTGLVHHSDRGVQYASGRYTAILQKHGIRISMSRTGNPWDNAACESFLKTLKYAEVYRSEYRDLADAWARVGEFLEEVYNHKRLHSALDYHSPATFEESLLSSPTLMEVPA